MRFQLILNIRIWCTRLEAGLGILKWWPSWPNLKSSKLRNGLFGRNRGSFKSWACKAAKTGEMTRHLDKHPGSRRVARTKRWPIEITQTWLLHVHSLTKMVKRLVVRCCGSIWIRLRSSTAMKIWISDHSGSWAAASRLLWAKIWIPKTKCRSIMIEGERMSMVSFSRSITWPEFRKGKHRLSWMFSDY